MGGQSTSANRQTKLKILKNYLWLFNLVPYSRSFFLVGSLAHGKVREKSDIDLVIYAKHNRVWLNRMLLNFVAGIAGIRRGTRIRANKFCFNASLSHKSNFNLRSLYPWAKPIKEERSSAIVTSTKIILEYLLEVTFLGPLLERGSKYFLTTYVNNRFRHFKHGEGTVLTLKNNQIIYHPPRLSTSINTNYPVVEKM